MRFKATLSVVLVAVVGMVGCEKKSPTEPNIVQTTTSSVRPAPLSIATVAPYIGQTINTVMEQALTQGLMATGANRWLRNCPAGGNAKIELPTNYQVEAGNVVMLDHDVVYTDCAIDTNVNALQPSLLTRFVNLIIRPVHAQARARIVGRGRLRTKGKWRPPIMSGGRWTYRDEPVRTTGSLDVSQANCGGGTCPSQIGPIQLDCGINGSVCAGSIGGVGVTQGPPDTPPGPNPTTTTSTTTTTTSVPSGGGFTVSPSPLRLPLANTCTGSTVSATATVTTGSTVPWTVRLLFTSDANATFSLSRTSGTGSGTVTVTHRQGIIPPCINYREPNGNSNFLTFVHPGGQVGVQVLGDVFLLE